VSLPPSAKVNGTYVFNKTANEWNYLWVNIFQYSFATSVWRIFQLRSMQCGLTQRGFNPLHQDCFLRRRRLKDVALLKYI
jgi:hypothetical protein